MTAETDTLVKPDMVAVLQRTHVRKDLNGFLLPTLEAVSNAMHGVEARCFGRFIAFKVFNRIAYRDEHLL